MTRPAPSIGRADREPIAIVGIGCRFPGASDPAAFWRLLLDGVDAIREIPPDRFDIDALYDEVPAQPGKVNTRWGGFVDGLDQFDAEFFGISPREAERLDPQQRLLLETSWEAIEDAGLVPAKLLGSATGVFVGMWINEYESRLFRNPAAIDFYMTTGSGRYAASGRLSYHYGLQGPSLTLDTGCSSSLVAVHLACQSLWSGESELALAGAANTIVEPFVTIAYSQSGMMAPDGRCKFGDAAANGYVRSDGAAIVILKPLSKAIADGNPIYATILGSAVTNDGRGSGFMTTPAREGQEEMLRRAYRDAGVSPGQVHYVEAHGTGTRAGDPVELGALGAILAIDRPADAPCRVGSVKTNIGHTEGAAGMAGLIKTVLSLKHRLIPKNLHLTTPNPEIPWASLPLTLQQTTEPWPAAGAAIAGVSSFGISGTNAHVVLGEAPAPVVKGTAADDRPALLTISGHTPDALRAMAAAWREYIASGPDASPVETCYSAAERRAHHTHRAAFSAYTFADLLDHLDAFAAGEPREGATESAVLTSPKVAFVFPGQGSQWVGMGRRLYETEPAFRSALDECDAAISSETGYSVVDVLIGREGAPGLDHIDVIQPALFAVQVSLAALWTSWGIRAEGVVGHSMGEIAAAYVAGALSLNDAVRVISLRSRLMKRTSGNGAMAVVELPAADAAAEIRDCESLLSVAVCNSSKSSVLSGDPAALDRILERLEARGVFCRRVKVDVASHSPQMDPLCGELLGGLASLQPSSGSVPFYSTAEPRSSGRPLGPDYWVKNLRQPVMFGDAVQQMIRDGHSVFIEMSPHPILTGAVREGIADAGASAITIGSTRRDEDERLSVLGSLGAAYAAGVRVDWTSVYPTARQTVAMPRYAFQRERFWFDSAPVESVTGGRFAAVAVHPLLRTPREIAGEPSQFVWTPRLSGDSLLHAHQLFGTPVVSASLYVELIAAAVSQVSTAPTVVIRDLAITRALLLAPQPDEVQIAALPEGRGSYRITVRSRRDDVWTTNAECRAAGSAESLPKITIPRPDMCVSPADSLYAELSRTGADILGPLRVVEQIAAGESFATGLLSPARPPRATSYQTDVIALDAAFQLAAWNSLVQRGPGAGLATPSLIRQVRVTPGASARAGVVSVQSLPSGDVVVQVADEAGHVVAELSGLVFEETTCTASAASRSVEGWFHAIEWVPEAGAIEASRPGAQTFLVVGSSAQANRLADAIACAGHTAAVVPADALASAIAEATAPANVVWLGPLEMAEGESQAGDSIPALEDASSAFVEIARVVAGASVDTRLHIMTVGAQLSQVNPAQSVFWGLGRTLAEEYPDRCGALIDLDPSEPDADPHQLAQRLIAGSGQHALRSDTWFAPRFDSLEAPAGAVVLRSDATYLITGGLGAIGLKVASWLVEHGARWLVLTGRHSLPPRAQWAAQTGAVADRINVVRDMERRGAHVRTVAVDVGDELAVRELIDAHEREARPAIRGVVHAAGVVEDRLLAETAADIFTRVFRAKVAGGWNLHLALQSSSLDFFVMCSSIAALAPQAGHGAYAAANAFLDGLAVKRREAGLPATSINWGGWEDVGFGTAAGARQSLDRLDEQGIGAFNGAEGLSAFGRLLNLDSAQAAVFPADWQRYEAARVTRESRIAGPAVMTNEATPQSPAEAMSILDALRASTDPVALLESHLIDELSAILRRPAARIDPRKPMVSMGLDSLMSVEYRRRLEKSFALPLSATLVWNYPTVDLLGAHILDRLGLNVPAAAPDPALSSPADADGGDLAELLNEIEELSDEEARRLLAGEI